MEDTEIRREDTERRRFLKLAGGAGAAGMLAVVAAACGGDDDEDEQGGGKASGGEASMRGDIEIVNYALTLEYLEADFYREVVKSGEIKDKGLSELAKQFGETEQLHVDTLISTVKKLGGEPAAKPRTNFEPVLNGGPKKILTTAAEVEDLGAAAYLGQAGRIKSDEILAAALSIHSVEARHASALNTALGKPATPDGAFAKPAAMDEVLKAVQPFIAS